ncbi:hypothetical protein [Deinococcus roseus]|uniref:Uncharacterized protein n=1 Tax=Deinococcus roseus TaxID=392414 RepID=A0ABQ2CW47_9DEIO|nr:hypothetical protein [Deinococcus roseus]GGJ26816.1 hypothetical protein GCM10008938_11170 [Deinococcus roseus]
MNLLTFQLPRGAGTIGVQIPVSREGLARVQTLLADPVLHDLDFAIQGLTVSLEFHSAVLANYFDLEEDARFQGRLNLNLTDPEVYSITATVCEVGYEAHAVTSLPVLCQLDREGNIMLVSLI